MNLENLGPYTITAEKIDENKSRKIYKPEGHDKAFLVENPHTIELRTDPKLGKLLSEKYESVMRSRYFGNYGIEIVLSGQLTQDEVNDLIKLSYNLTTFSKNRESL